jgi:hypothetical protein
LADHEIPFRNIQTHSFYLEEGRTLPPPPPHTQKIKKKEKRKKGRNPLLNLFT